MRVLAFSDLHGEGAAEAGALVQELQPDWIVLLGDILPDFLPFGPQRTRLDSQREYWRSQGCRFRREGAVTTFVRGNHELEGFEAAEDQVLPPDLRGTVVRLEGIPAASGRWGWSREWSQAHLEEELADQIRRAPEPAIVLSHVPPLGVLDQAQNGGRIGHGPLRCLLDSRAGRSIALVLCGHAHQARGAIRHGAALVVNMAGGFAWLDLVAGVWSVKAMGGLPERDLDAVWAPTRVGA
jgi:Icc-related predicted phosphoesterase